MAFNYNGSTWQISTTFATSGYPLTLSAWFRKSSNALRGALVVYSTSDPSRFWIGINASGNPLMSVTSNTGLAQSSTCATAMPNNTWVHVTGVFASNSSRIVYYNGVQDGINTNTRDVSAMDSLIIGGIWTSGTSSGNRWNGDLAEVVIYNKGLSASDVSTLYRGGPKILPANNLIFWDRMIDVNRKDIVRRTAYSFSSGTNTLVTSHPRTF